MEKDWSVIVPVLNERERLPKLIEELNQKMPEAELIVVDGISDDGTWEWLQEQKNILSYQCSAGRGSQLAQGVKSSQGEYLWFLHADSVLPEKTWEIMEKLLKKPGTSAGAYRLALEHSSWHYRLMETFVHWRCRLFQLPYGDQGIFIKRSFYERVGGFRLIPLMEDVDLCRRVKKLGRIELADMPLITSPRRMESRGFWFSCVRNIFLVMLFHFQVPPKTLRKLYER